MKHATMFEDKNVVVLGKETAGNRGVCFERGG